MKASSRTSPPKVFLLLPARVRSWLAQFAVWRLRKRSSSKPNMPAFFSSLMVLSLSVFLINPETALAGSHQPSTVPAHLLGPSAKSAAALPALSVCSDPVFRSTEQWGELQAEVLQLHMLYSQILDATGLNKVKRSLMAQLSDRRFQHSRAISELHPDAPDRRFALAKRAVGHITDQIKGLLSGYRTRYAHNDSNLVEVGERVSKGQLIAKMGSKGRSTGTYVHREVHQNGQAVDPMLIINAGTWAS